MGRERHLPLVRQLLALLAIHRQKKPRTLPAHPLRKRLNTEREYGPEQV